MGQSRRAFLKGTAASALIAAMPSVEANPRAPAPRTTPLYPNPGRLVAVTDARAVIGSGRVDETVVQAMFDEAVMRFTGLFSSPSDALASLFPGLTANSRIAIKPNLINSSTPTRKELVKALIRRLMEMPVGLTPSHITLYERHSFSANGYTTQYFGAPVNLVVDSTFPDLGYTIHCDGKDRPYSKSLHDADYLVNMPVLKDHGCSMGFTMAFKNHMGTVNPGGPLGICSNKRAVLDIMANPVMTGKQVFILMDCLFAVINGGPGGSPQAVPATITLSQDPVTTDYFGRGLINDLRRAQAYAPKPGTYIEEAAAPPFSIGIADPSRMNIITINYTTPLDERYVPVGWTLSDCYPNPFRGTAEFLLDMSAPGFITATVFTIEGRREATLQNGPLPAGTTSIRWKPSKSREGTYFLVIDNGKTQAIRKMVYIP
ncbi:MAG: DUF362 domain-containing protein [Bacteroidota bacterium]|nr:DUF362 domain-containing protein [Bacteroidota bacterium]